MTRIDFGGRKATPRHERFAEALVRMLGGKMHSLAFEWEDEGMARMVFDYGVPPCEVSVSINTRWHECPLYGAMVDGNIYGIDSEAPMHRQTGAIVNFVKSRYEVKRKAMERKGIKHAR